MQEFLALLRLHGVPVTPAHGMPSGPRTVMEPVEKRSVVGRGLRHPQATYAAALGQPQPRRQRQQQQRQWPAPSHCQQRGAQYSASGCSCRQPQQDADMADASQPGAAAGRRHDASAQRPSASQMEAAVGGLLEAVVPQHMRQVSDVIASRHIVVYDVRGLGGARPSFILGFQTANLQSC